MRRVLPDLWETRADAPFPGLTTHAYLWIGNTNVLFYSTAGDADFAELERLGGFTDQYLSHQDEAGPMLSNIAERFGSRLHAPAAEVDEIGRFTPIDVPLDERHVDGNGVEVLPTPGHTVGSTCYLVRGVDGGATCSPATRSSSDPVARGPPDTSMATAMPRPSPKAYGFCRR